MTGAPAGNGALFRNFVRLGCLLVLVWASLWLLDWVHVASDAMPGPGGRLVYLAVLGLALAIYALLLALP